MATGFWPPVAVKVPVRLSRCLAAATRLAHTSVRHHRSHRYTMFVENIRPYFFSTLAAAMVSLAMPAGAQSLKTGDIAVLASYYEIRGSDCLPLRAPRVTITLQPRLGVASIVQTRGQSGDSGRCAYKTVPIAQLVYQANQPGSDSLAWEVKYQNKTIGIRRYSATLGIAPAP